MFSFAANPTDYPYETGDLLCGFHHTEQGKNAPVGVKAERHAVTVAGSRMGKGVGPIISNLMIWPYNALVIDPKGEAAEATHKYRAGQGQKVVVLDPFKSADVPTNIRGTWNPLADLDPDSDTINEEIGTIADGLVMRSGASSDVTWDDGGEQIIAGLIAFVLTNLPKQEQNLLAVREILTDAELKEIVFEEMGKARGGGCAALMRGAATAAAAKEGRYFVSNAVGQTKWLDSDAMQKFLRSSSLSIYDLKHSDVSVFLVLPPNRMDKHGRFLRLFVRCGLDAMGHGNVRKDRECLFVLDEFFSLGYISEIAKSAGLMPGYGLHMWVILQDLGQLQTLYGREGMQTFLGSADVQQFFGNSDAFTLEYISKTLGNFTVDDMPEAPTYDPDNVVRDLLDEIEEDRSGWFGNAGRSQGKVEAAKTLNKYENEVYRERLGHYRDQVSRVLGRPRLTPEQIADLVAKKPDLPVALREIVFVGGLRPLFLNNIPFFMWDSEHININFPNAKKAKSKSYKDLQPFDSNAFDCDDFNLHGWIARQHEATKPIREARARDPKWQAYEARRRELTKQHDEERAKRDYRDPETDARVRREIQEILDAQAAKDARTMELRDED